MKHTSIDKKRIVDLGCGGGVLAKKLAAAGATVDAIDISNNALKLVKQYEDVNIRPIQDVIPFTKLEDDAYDIVISTEILGYLPHHERRLYFAELSRLVKPEGFVISSTSLDIYTQNALEIFSALVETEFHPIEWAFSYHALFIRTKNFLKMPLKFAKGYQDRAYREKKINERLFFSKWWYKLNSSKLIGPFWNIIRLPFQQLINFFDSNRSLLLHFEKVCRFLNADSGISHVIFICQRKPFEIPTQEKLVTVEPKHKRQVWE